MLRAVFSFLVLAGLPIVNADSPRSSRFIFINEGRCEEHLVLPAGAFEPFYTAKTPPPFFGERDFDQNHKTRPFLSFSPDGKMVLIRHYIYPDAEQVSIRRVESGELLATFFWRGKSGGLADLRDATVDGNHGRLLALGDNWATDRTEEIIAWDFAKGSQTVFEVPSPGKQLFRPSIKSHSGFKSIQSPLSNEHPYYFRLVYNAEEGTALSQIFNWKTKGVTAVPDVFPQLLPDVLPGGNPFQSQIGFVALPSLDLMHLNIYSFSELEKHMIPIKPSLWDRWIGRFPWKRTAPSVKLVDDIPHAHPILAMQVVQGSEPLVITQTQEGLFVWNVELGSIVAQLPEAKSKFRLLEKMNVIAYLLPDNRLAMFSLSQKKTIGYLENFADFHLEDKIHHWQDGVAYVIDLSGKLYRFEEKTGFVDTQIESPLVKIGTRLSVLSTAKDEYAILFSERSTANSGKDFIFSVFSLTKKQLVADWKFSASAFFSYYDLDPTRTRVFYTLSNEKTGYVNLEELLGSQGL